MTLGIGLLYVFTGGVAIFAVAALLRGLAMNLFDAKTGSVWDWFWGIVLGDSGSSDRAAVNTLAKGAIPQCSNPKALPALGRP
mgnify:FL=1